MKTLKSLAFIGAFAVSVGANAGVVVDQYLGSSQAASVNKDQVLNDLSLFANVTIDPASLTFPQTSFGAPDGTNHYVNYGSNPEYFILYFMRGDQIVEHFFKNSVVDGKFAFTDASVGGFRGGSYGPLGPCGGCVLYSTANSVSATVPEPTPLALISLGVVGLILSRRKQS